VLLLAALFLWLVTCWINIFCFLFFLLWDFMLTLLLRVYLFLCDSFL